MKNKVFDYLSRLRFHYMQRYFDEELHKFCGSSAKIQEKKKFYESFIENSAFDFASPLFKLCNSYFAKTDNYVYMFAMSLFSVVEITRLRYQERKFDYLSC